MANAFGLSSSSRADGGSLKVMIWLLESLPASTGIAPDIFRRGAPTAEILPHRYHAVARDCPASNAFSPVFPVEAPLRARPSACAWHWPGNRPVRGYGIVRKGRRRARCFADAQHDKRGIVHNSPTGNIQHHAACAALSHPPTYAARCFPVNVVGDATSWAGVPSNTIRPPS